MEQHFFACFVCLRYMERRHGVPAMDRKKRGDERAFLWVWYVTIPTFYVVEKIAVLSDFMRYPACLFFVSKGEFLHRRRTTTTAPFNVVLREEFFAVIFVSYYFLLLFRSGWGKHHIKIWRSRLPPRRRRRRPPPIPPPRRRRPPLHLPSPPRKRSRCYCPLTGITGTWAYPGPRPTSSDRSTRRSWAPTPPPPTTSSAGRRTGVRSTWIS